MQEGNKKEENSNDEVKEVKKKQKRRNPLATLGCGIRALSCGGCLFIILLIVGGIFLLTSKPAGLWTFTVNFLNAGVDLSTYPTVENSTQVKQEINNQVTTIGVTNIVVTQEQLTSLLRDKYPDLKNLTAYVTPDKITIYWDVDNTIKNNPLEATIEMRTDDSNKLNLTRFGTKRIAIPSFLNNYLTSVFNILASTSTSTSDKYAFLTNLLSANNIKITNISLDDQKIDIKADVKVNLFN
jgi:hypothetical protein